MRVFAISGAGKSNIWKGMNIMERLFEYLDNEMFCHHTIDREPDPKRFYVHVHERMEIFYLISGTVSYIVEGSAYKLNPKDVVITNRGEAHKVEVSAGQPYERISIQFDVKLLEQIDPDGLLLRPFQERPLGMLNHYPAAGNSQGGFLSAFESFDRDYSNARKRLHLLTVILSVMSQICDEFDAVQDDVQYAHVEGVAQRMIGYINARIFENITLSSISRDFFLCESQISRIFKKATGSSIGEYIRMKRLVAAREKLLEGESAAMAAQSCGFRDYSSFYRAYKARFGYSPSETVPPHLAGVADEVREFDTDI